MAKKDLDINDLFKTLESKFNAYFEPEKIQTGIIPFDLALNGYLETGSLIELSGESQTGKSTLLMHLSRAMCEMGYKVVYIDAEGSVKEDQMAGIGLMPYLSTNEKKDNLFTLVKESGYNQVEQLIDLFLKYGGYKLFIIDSLTALTGDVYLDISNAGSENDRLSTENRVGFDALMTSRLLKKLNGLKTEHNCIFIFINQTRVDMSGFYTTYKSSGGQAVKFFPDVRLFMKLKDKIVDKRELALGIQDVPIGAHTTIEAHKSRLGLGYIPYPMTVYFGKGISNLDAYLELLPKITATVDGKKVPMLEKLSSVSYVLHLKDGDVRTSAGVKGLYEMVRNNSDKLSSIIDSYLDEFFTSLHSPVEITPENTLTVEVKREEEEEDE